VILYPAIDIRGGKAVRLLQGDYARETTYDADPVDVTLSVQDALDRYALILDDMILVSRS